MSEIDCLIWCIGLRNTNLAATRSFYSVKRFLQSLHLLHGLKSNVTNSTCSFLTFGNIVTGISSWLFLSAAFQQLTLNIHMRPNIALLIRYETIFGNVKCGKCDKKFGCTLKMIKRMISVCFPNLLMVELRLWKCSV